VSRTDLSRIQKDLTQTCTGVTLKNRDKECCQKKYAVRRRAPSGKLFSMSLNSHSKSEYTYTQKEGTIKELSTMIFRLKTLVQYSGNLVSDWLFHQI